MSYTQQNADAPYDEVVFLVVNKGRDATVEVDGSIRRILLLALAQVQVDELVLESELFENDDCLPVQICEWKPL